MAGNRLLINTPEAEPADLMAYIANRSKVDERGCWIWQKSTRTGYGAFIMTGIHIYAHRAAFEALNGCIPPDMLVLHHCDVRLCCNPDHLYLGDYTDNINDAYHRGERRNRKLHRDDIPDIMRYRRLGETWFEIGERYGTSKQAVLQMVKRWSRKT